MVKISSPIFMSKMIYIPLGRTSILSLCLGPSRIIERQEDRMSVMEHATSPLSLFLYALGY